MKKMNTINRSSREGESKRREFFVSQKNEENELPPEKKFEK